jgi:dihydroneopterin aldolase
MDADEIIVRGLDLPVRIGVPDEERASWQVISADLRLGLQRGFDVMHDDLGETLDYVTVVNRVKGIAAERPRRLLEKLAAEIVSALLRTDQVTAVEVELRKRILPGTDHVAVRMRRSRS